MQPIELTDVRKDYGTTRALDGVSLTFEPGAVHALVGPNGSGKTTLFRVLLGLTRPDAGQVSTPEADVACGFQTPQLYPGLTVEENLSVFADLVEATDAWVETLVEACGLDRVRDREASALSAGFAKRLDVAIALLGRPGVLLLDEPLADVDAEHRDRIRSLLASYANEDRIVVLATHRLTAFEDLVDTVTVIEDGTVRASTPRTDLSVDLETYYAETRTD